MTESRSGRPQAALALALLGGLLAAVPASAGFGDPIRGQQLFVSKRCVACHAVRGTGGRIGPDLGRTLAKGSFFELAAALWNHSVVMHEKMREFRLTRPTFEASELADLVAFLYFLNYFDEPGDPQFGKVLFAEKHCIQCHRLGRVGGQAGPRLDSLPRGTPPLKIAQDLWNHGPVMVPAIRGLGLNVPEFQGSEIVDLFAYLRSQGQRKVSRDFRSAGDPTKGERLFETKECSRCHALFGSRPAIGPDLGKTELRGSVTQLAGRMWNHWPAMSQAMSALGLTPPTFQGEELADVFAYLFMARYEGQKGSRERGRAIYAKKGCAYCHGPVGEGGRGPSLRGVTSGAAKEAIAQRMWNHAPGMVQKMGNEQIPFPRFAAEELADLFAFLGQGLQTASAGAEPEGHP